MAKKSMKNVAKIMGSLDICMLTTISGRGMTTSRPMSTNGDVKYDGSTYFFTWAKSPMVKDIEKNNHVNLAFTGSKMLKKLFVSVAGQAKVVKDRSKMQDHWNKDLEIWFDKGLDTPGIAMIEVKAKQIKYWHGREEGELKLKN